MAATSDRGSRSDPAAPAEAVRAKYVLPTPPRPANWIVDGDSDAATREVAGEVVQAVGRPAAVDLREIVLVGQADARAALAERWIGLLECQDHFLAELRQALGELRQDAVHGDRGCVQAHGQTLEGILDWAEATLADLRREAEQAREGRCPVDVAELVREIAAEIEAENPDLRVQVVETSRKTRAWGEPRLLRRGLRSAVVAVLCRGGEGVAAEVGHEAGRVRVHLVGLGEPKPLRDRDLADEVRDLLGTRHGALLRPGPSGPGGTGLEILLPRAW